MGKKSRNTLQKEALQGCIEAKQSFFTAEEIHQQVQKKNPQIGLATVYRYLKDLKTRQILHAYSCDRHTIYSKHRSSHCHFVCECCNQITHFEVKDLDFLRKGIPGSICHFQIEVSGICKNCSKHNHEH